MPQTYLRLVNIVIIFTVTNPVNSEYALNTLNITLAIYIVSGQSDICFNP